MSLPLQQAIEFVLPADELGLARLDVLFGAASWAMNPPPPPRGSRPTGYHQRYNDPDHAGHHPEHEIADAVVALRTRDRSGQRAKPPLQTPRDRSGTRSKRSSRPALPCQTRPATPRRQAPALTPTCSQGNRGLLPLRQPDEHRSSRRGQRERTCARVRARSKRIPRGSGRCSPTWCRSGR